MFDLMQYALIFYDFQLILAQMGSPPEWPSGIRRPVHEHILTMICDDHNRLFLQE